VLAPVSRLPGAQVVDIFVNFFLMYSTFDVRVGLVWVEDHRAIVHHYVRGWLTVDLLSTLVSAFDIIALALEPSGENGETNAAGQLQSFKVLKLMRGLRLVKLLRLLRGSRIFRRCTRRWHCQISLFASTRPTCGQMIEASCHDAHALHSN
jgi:hypothetical protein